MSPVTNRLATTPTTPITPRTMLTPPQGSAKGRSPEHGHAKDDETHRHEEAPYEEDRVRYALGRLPQKDERCRRLGRPRRSLVEIGDRGEGENGDRHHQNSAQPESRSDVGELTSPSVLNGSTDPYSGISTIQTMNVRIPARPPHRKTLFSFSTASSASFVCNALLGSVSMVHSYCRTSLLVSFYPYTPDRRQSDPTDSVYL